MVYSPTWCAIIGLIILASTTTSAQFESNSLSQAVDNTEYDFLTEGSANFFRQTQEFTRGGDAAQSGRIGNGQITVMAVEVQGPITISFDWKVSSQSRRDLFGIVVLDQNKRPSGISKFISGERDWARVSIDIPAGKFFPTWGYAKDRSGSAGQDAGWVDRIRIGSSPTIPVEQLLPPIIDYLLFEPITQVDIPAANQLRPPMPSTLESEFIFKLESESDPYDFVGNGNNYEYRAPADDIGITVNRREIVQFRIGPVGELGGDWSFSMFNDEQRLTPGVYTDAPDPVFAVGRSGFAISGFSRTCGDARRSDFTIHEIVYGSSGKPSRLVMDFVQRCSPNSGGLFGSIIYDKRLEAK